MSDSAPSTSTQQSAVNPNGQKSSMSGTTQVFTPPGMCWTPCVAIDPTGSQGAKQFENK